MWQNSTFRRWDKILYNSSIAIAHHILVLCTFCFDVNSPMPLDYMETKSLGIWHEGQSVNNMNTFIRITKVENIKYIL